MTSAVVPEPTSLNHAPRSQDKVKQQACDIYHRRKVKCNAQDRQTYTNCQLGSLECTFFILHQQLQKVGSKRRESMRSRGQRPLQSRTSSTPITTVSTALQTVSGPGPSPSLPQQHVEPSPKHSLVLNENDIFEEGLARTALTEFLHHSFHSPTFSVFH